MSLPGPLRWPPRYVVYIVNTITTDIEIHPQKEYTVTLAKLGVLRKSRRLANKGVKSGCKDLLAAQCISKCLLVDDTSSGRIDQDCGRLHRLELFRSYHVLGSRSKWDMNSDDVGPTEKIVDICDQVHVCGGHDRFPGVQRANVRVVQ